VRFQLTLALLAQHHPDSGRELQRALHTARQQVNGATARGAPVSPGVWFELERAAQRLQGLVDRLDGKDASNAPPLASLAEARIPLRNNAAAFYTMVKDSTLALERRPPEQVGPPVTAKVPGALQFAVRGQAAQAAFPYGTQHVAVVVPVEALPAGTRVTLKVYAVTVFESRELRRELRYDGPPGGQLRLEIAEPGSRNLPPGPYRVEVYFENHLMAGGSFSIDGDTASR
jgi:hypothetical protein